MNIKANIKVNMGGVTAKVRSIAKNQQLGQFLANEAARGMDKYVPMRTGALADFTVVTPFHVKYAVPYAKYPYNGRGKLSKDKHPNATSKWDRAYAIAEGQKLGQAGTRFVKSL